MKNKAKFPAVTVFYDDTDYWLVDGFHRLAAAKKKGKTTINVEILHGSLLNAQWYSFGVNKTHGLRRSNEDKRKAVEGALEHAQGSGRTDSVIAEHCGVTHPLVSEVRKSLESTGRFFQSKARIGKDGRAYDVSNTQEANKKRVAKTTTPTTTTSKTVVETPAEAEGVLGEHEAVTNGLGRPVPAALAPAFRLVGAGFDAIRNKVIVARTAWNQMQVELEQHPWVSRIPSYTLPLPACLPHGAPANVFRNREARAVESIIQASLHAGAELQSSRARFRKNLQSSPHTTSASVRGSGATL